MCMCSKKVLREVTIKVTEQIVYDKLNQMIKANINLTNWFNNAVLEAKI